jgi:hypothetical protein
MRKMSLHDRTHAVVVAIGQGWINVPIEEPDRATVIPTAPANAAAED